ncbi:trypsin-like serine peptidase [Microcella sp.]|uniref:trypsin-like serine peptidase n=1 Tax=Microcella sp. TaxID=1913979 RepID=UPI003F6E5F0C
MVRAHSVGGRALLGTLAVVALFLTGCTASSDDATPDLRVPVEIVPAAPLPLDQLAAFSGVVSLNAGSNCSGTLIDTGVDAGPAYVLTNGHCTGDVGRPAQVTTIGIDWGGTAEFLLADGYTSAFSVEVVELSYSTMRHTDTAIVRLDATLGELTERGIRAVPLTDTEPTPGSAVVNVGVPVQDLAPEEWVLRRGDCTLGEQRTLIEFQWLWFGAWQNDCPGIIQGSSGSPLLSVDANGEPTAIVGMINTTTLGTLADRGGECWLNRPCEVLPGGVERLVDTSYAVSVAGVGACFDAAGEFSLAGDCPLPTSSIWNEGVGGSFQGAGVPDSVGRVAAVSFVGVSEGLGRWALVPLGDGAACLDPATYANGTAVEIAAGGEVWEQFGTEFEVPLPDEEGRYVLCGVAGEDYAGAASVLFTVDRTPPVLSAGAVIERDGEDGVLVWPFIDPPEISTVRFVWGAPGEVDCDDADAFTDFFVMPLFLTDDQLPIRYCVYGMDEAGNRTPVEVVEIAR